MKRKLVLAMVLISFCGMFLLSPERVQASQTVVEVFISEDDLDVSEENIQESPTTDRGAAAAKA
ncbi:cell surface protein, partial [Listeria monocytogenes]